MVKIPDIQFANTGLRADTAFQTPTQADTGPAEFAGAVFAGLDEVSQRIRSRADTVNRIRTVDKFKQDAFDNFTRSQTEMDLTDPETVKTFNQQLRQKAADYLKNFKGSPDARVQVESELGNILTGYTTQMTSNSITAQRQFVMSKAGEQINQLAAQVSQDPAYLPEAFKQLGTVVNDVSPAIYAEDELELISAAQEQLAVTALQSYTDKGMYEEARDVINQNPFFMQSMSPESQKSILREIQGGISAKEKALKETKQKITVIKSAAQELGVELSGNDVFTAVTGIQSKQAPQEKIDEFARLTRQDVNTLTPSVIAKIGYGVDLPSASEIDFNKEYTPTGDFTPKGIRGQVKEPFDKAAASKTLKDKVDGAINLFKQDGNTQALLSAMITFQKALDEGAIVREGDIALQRSAQSLSDRINLVVEQAETGQVVSTTLVDQMQKTMEDFTRQSLEANKLLIDPLLVEAERLGYRRVGIIPREAYDQVFKGVKTPVDRKAEKLQTIQNIAKQNGVSLEELLESTAAASGKAINEIKKDFEID